jgi:hypothetical protein
MTTTPFTLTDCTTPDKFLTQLELRSGLSSINYFIRKQLDNIKCYTGGACPYPVLVNKKRSYPNQIFFYHELTNLVFAVDQNTKVAVTVLYLDGKDGYNELVLRKERNRIFDIVFSINPPYPTSK